MEESKLDVSFWENRYKSQQTGWDIGFVSPPIKEYIDQLTNKELRILIPGCGRGYEGAYLHEKGFKNVYPLDFAQQAFGDFKRNCPTFPIEHFIQGDFFEHEGKYDLIIEQTMFCAIDPSLRQAYANKIHEILNEKGKLVGLFFNREFEGGPPFGGSYDEYMKYFEPLFRKVEMTPCYNSLPPRMGSELFVKISK